MNKDDSMPVLTARDYKGLSDNEDMGGAVIPVEVYDYYNMKKIDKDCVGTLTDATGHNGSGSFRIALPIKEAVKKGYTEAEIGDSVNIEHLDSDTRRGRVGKGVANTLDTACSQGVIVKLNDNCTVYAIWYEKYQCYVAIRKLTPKECFRLQGWSDDYFEKARFVNSDSQLYKQAGNGVTVGVVYEVAKRLKTDENTK